MQTQSLPFTEAPVLSVSALNRQARLLLEDRLGEVRVRGEIGNFRRPGSGHWYFTLKDESAQVRCAMFRNRNRLSRLQPADGAEVLLRGRVSLFEGRGDYQIVVEHMEPAGEGALRAAFEALKDRLAAEGLFRVERKKPLPPFPAHLAILSSRSGAALRDVLSVVRRRFPCLQVTLLPVAVQGPDAVPQMLAALNRVPALEPDVVLLTRGGGSLEDLFEFNSEPLARAIAACPVPTVAAIGHETDFTIAELVADLRGPTPSAAAELITPDGDALGARFVDFEARLLQGCNTRIHLARARLTARHASLTDPRRRVQQLMQRADDLDERLRRAVNGRLAACRARTDALRRATWLLRPTGRIENYRRTLQRLAAAGRQAATAGVKTRNRRLAALTRTLQAVSPLDTLARGFAIVTDGDGRAVTSASGLESGAEFAASFHDGAVDAVVRRKRPLPERLRPIHTPKDEETA